MKKSFVGLVLAVGFSGAALAQNLGTVVQSQCVETTKESVVGAGVGAVAGVVAGKAVSSLFGLGRTGDTISKMAGGAVGGIAGNAIGSRQEYQCTLLIDYNGKNVLHSGLFPVKIHPGNVLSVSEAQGGSYYVGIR